MLLPIGDVQRCLRLLRSLKLIVNQRRRGIVNGMDGTSGDEGHE
jgi:hypothetical protein